MPNHHACQKDERPLDDQSGTLDQHRLRALRMLLLAAGVAVPVVALAIFLRDGITPLTLLVGAASALVWLLGLLFHRGHVHVAAHGLVLIILAIATVATVLTGGVRSAGVFVLLVSMVLAGTFLSRGKMIAVVLYSIVALGVINSLEQRGMLPGALPPTGWAVWVIQTVVIVIVLVSNLAGQYRLQEAFATQRNALALAYDAEAALRASQERFKALFRNNPAACIVQSMDTRLLMDANEAYAQMSGFSRDELVGQQPPQVWADPAEARAFRALLKSHGRVSGMHARGLRRDGSEFDSMVYAEIIQQGDERLMIGMVLDVSAETASRTELEKSRERFSKAFNFSPLGMTITRLSDGRFMEVNPANERVLGYTQADFEGKTSEEVGVWLTEADRQAYVRTLQRDGRLVGYETHMRSKRGEVVPVRVWSETIDIDGEPCSLAFTLNVADEKRREAMLLNVAEGVSGETGEAFFRSLAGHLSQALGADGVMVGELDEHRRLHTLATLWDGSLHPNRDHELSFTLCEQALTHRDMLLQEYPSPRHLPLLPPFEQAALEVFVGLPLCDADGSTVGLLTVVWRQRPQLQDDLQALLTIFASRCNAELMRLRRDREILRLQDTLEQRVQERTEQLQYLNRELDAFAYTVSHDLKSPLRAIDGFMHLLQEQTSGRLQHDD